ncbi:MAG: hypothetical protein IKI64_08725 [Clostridia bacterium]|nr:hypothetical protein [Clostridia bacterium]
MLRSTPHFSILSKEMPPESGISTSIAKGDFTREADFICISRFHSALAEFQYAQTAHQFLH